ncbi:hypothetical protein NR224_04915 [Pediococcus ethanolidurans]|uniref:hypothetical protein n=1 Tax=Pediococcus ethanolidurans TaxID=319653 RepID=UPI0021E72D6F|nr:hypothetical protein [Pediococcus ethanolidurans]MCV3321544.1 hypothetical protein [Pediococcus ethanolidurans]
MTNKEISDELDDLAYQTRNMEHVLQLVQEKIEDIGMIKDDSELVYEFKRLHSCISDLIDDKTATSHKMADRISVLAMELLEPDKVR